MERERQRQTETDRDRDRQTDRQTETDRDRDRQTDSDRDRQRQRQTGRPATGKAAHLTLHLRRKGGHEPIGLIKHAHRLAPLPRPRVVHRRVLRSLHPPLTLSPVASTFTHSSPHPNTGPPSRSRPRANFIARPSSNLRIPGKDSRFRILEPGIWDPGCSVRP